MQGALGPPWHPRLSSPAFCKNTLSHAGCSLPPQRPQTKTKPPQAAGPSSPQRPKTPEEAKPASPGPQEDTDTDGEQSGQRLRGLGLREEGLASQVFSLREEGAGGLDSGV